MHGLLLLIFRCLMKSKMVISIDYDNTWTRDPEGWMTVALLLRDLGHTVFGVTLRFPHEDEYMDTAYFQTCERVFFTSNGEKDPYMQSQGIQVDVWIDDMPELIRKVTLIGAK